jgi:hypothetical protein
MQSAKKMLRGALAIGALTALATVSAIAQDANATYKPPSTGKDPFSRYKVAFKLKARDAQKKQATVIQPPSLPARIDQYKAQKMAAMNLRQPAPKPTTALLLSELQVTGIFRTPRGYAAMVEAKPIKLSYVVYPGEPFFDGMLVAIEETQLVFRREANWTDGRREVIVETKPLRQPDVKEVMTAPKTDEAGESSPGAKESKGNSTTQGGGAESGSQVVPNFREGGEEVHPESGPQVLYSDATAPAKGSSTKAPAKSDGKGYWPNRKALDNSPCQKGIMKADGTIICQ